MRVCVFGSSSSNTLQPYLDAAHALGEEIAKRHFICVNGGGANGVMGALNEGCTNAGGHIIGVIHEMFVVDKQEDSRIKQLIVCKGSDLKERKQKLLDNADCLIVMPGGVGTFDELWDAVCTKSLGLGGLSHKPICVVNVNGFFDGSIMQLRRAGEDRLLHRSVDTYFQIHNNAADALDWCAQQVTIPNNVDEIVFPILRKPQEPTLELDLAGSLKEPSNAVKHDRTPRAQDDFHSSVYFGGLDKKDNDTNRLSNLWFVVGITVGIAVGLILGSKK